MPSYDYLCSQCNTTFERQLKMAAREEPQTQPCPECNTEGTVKQVILGAPGLGDPIRLGIKKPDAGWGEVLNKVKTAHPKGHWDQKKFVPQAGR